MAKPCKSISAGRLLNAVQQFHVDSLNERYREDFNVNSRNFMEMSEGTRTWIRKVIKLFEQAVEVGNGGDRHRGLQALDLLFDLLDRIDNGEDFIFFADEAGSWQVGVEYAKVFPAYFAALAVTADADDYAGRVLQLVTKYASYDRDKHLRVARRAANGEQRSALRRLMATLPKTGRQP